MSQNDDQEAQATSHRLALHRYLSQITHFIDDNIRIVQGVTYAVAAVGVLRVLHSARAFTRFSRLDDIPPEFVQKNVQLRGVVRWVGTQPPSTLSVPVPAPGRADKLQSVTADAGVDVPPSFSSSDAVASGSTESTSTSKVVSQVLANTTESTLGIPISNSDITSPAPPSISQYEAVNPEVAVKPTELQHPGPISVSVPSASASTIAQSSESAFFASGPAVASSTSEPAVASSTSGPTAASSTSGPVAASPTLGPTGSAPSTSGLTSSSSAAFYEPALSAAAHLSVPSPSGPSASINPSPSSGPSPSSSGLSPPSSGLSPPSSGPSPPSSGPSPPSSGPSPPSSGPSPPSSGPSPPTPTSPPTSSPDADDALSNTEYQQRRSNLAKPKGSSLSSKEKLGDLTPLYLLVEHVPVFRTPLQQSRQLLLVSLAAVEVSERGAQECAAQLLQQRVWFRLLYVQAAPRLLVCGVSRTALGFKKWRTLNEDLVRRGNGVLSLVPDSSAIEQLALHTPSRFERWQRTAVTWCKGPPPDTALARVDPSTLKEISLIPPSYYSLYERIRKAEMYAKKRRIGVWKDYEGDAEGWFITRLWYRFRSYTRKA